MKKGFTLIELLVVIVIIGILASIALPNYIRVKDKAKEAEVKSNLHNIQLSIERFAVDTEGTYPQYLIGGDLKYSNNPNINANVNALTDITVIADRNQVSDPLLRRGYVDSYPKNPFARNGAAIHKFQEDVNDRMRSGANGPIRGCRFGGTCTIMGNVSADHRFPQFVAVTPGQPPQLVESQANFENFRFFDLWLGNRPKLYLPGEFIYKSNGPIIAASPESIDPNRPIQPIEVDQYIMAGYGSIRSKGSDILGPEPSIVAFTAASLGAADFDILASYRPTVPEFGPMQGDPGDPGGGGGGTNPASLIRIPSWTRWMNRQIGNSFPGSPFSASSSLGLNQLEYGNPNGIKDAIILALTAGEDTKGARN
ncbi:MAG: type II secretion system protein [bacterium]|jgi:prepilin-type N-terminal cleavage/methylation domain-containing protein